MNKKTPRPSMQFEDKWLAEELRKSLDGVSHNAWARQHGIDNGQVHLSYLLNGKRGLSFWKAVRIATAAGVDLGRLQLLLLGVQGKPNFHTP